MSRKPYTRPNLNNSGRASVDDLGDHVDRRGSRRRRGSGGTFGQVVVIGGEAIDLALDESRGVLYIANFTANRIDVMSLANQPFRRPSTWMRTRRCLAVADNLGCWSGTWQRQLASGGTHA